MQSFDLDTIIFDENTPIQNVLEAINQTACFTENKGFAIIVNSKKECVGIATDGDIRHYLVVDNDLQIPISTIAQKNYIYASPDESTNSILRKFESNALNIPVLNETKQVVGLLNYSSFSVFRRSREHIIRARVPGRISFSGGGTDMSHLFDELPTSVLSTTIDKFCVTSLMTRNDNEIHIYSKNLNRYYQAKDITSFEWGDELDLVKYAILKMQPAVGVTIEISSEIEIGTGLGGSSAMVASVLAVLNELNPTKKLDRYELSDLAYQVERMDMKMLGGWQDQYSTIFGGFNWIEFNQNEILVNPLRIDHNTMLELHYNLMLFRVGTSRKSAEVHKSATKKPLSPKKEQYFLEQMNLNTTGIKRALLKNRVKDFGDHLHNAWELKNKINSGVSNDEIDELYEIARSCGALGGKLLGAGKSGYLLIYSSPLYQEKITEAFSQRNIYKQKFNFNPNGVEIWKVPK